MTDQKNIEVKFYDNVDDRLLKFAVIISRSNGQWVFCKHKERNTYEVPGGHREKDELILDTAKRELKEETGAVGFTIRPVCISFEEIHSEIEKIIFREKASLSQEESVYRESYVYIQNPVAELLKPQ